MIFLPWSLKWVDVAEDYVGVQGEYGEEGV